MKKYWKIIIYVFSFVGVLTLASFGYRYLIKTYIPEDVKTEEKKESLKVASNFTVLNSKKEQVDLKDFFGKPIVVNFWATWCGPCKSELPEFEEAYKKYGESVEFLMVNLTDGYNETVENTEKFVKDNNYTFPLYFDTEYSASDTYRLYSIPQTLFINKEGKILKLFKGMINKQTIENYIEKLLEE